MPDPESLERIVGKAMLDSAFRTQLLMDPIAAAKSIGIALSDAMAKRIQGIDPKALDQLAMEFQNVAGLGEIDIKFW